MAGVVRPDGDRPAGDDSGSARAEAADLVAQIRDLAGSDPAGVQQVVAEVLAALDRASGGRLRDQLPPGTPFGSGYTPAPPQRDDDTAAGARQRPPDRPAE
ncbi:hypothetical protein [Micromonospora zhanjiangensis]|uniref:Uncharacterized protein n=1 Tax=Micromonospora zhanjiangensis TaxID=1522057 RepID=A0ABV8KSP7_9ACTN